MNLLHSSELDRLLRSAPAGAKVYLIGAGGCGMSGLGHLLLDLGLGVAGSDLTCSPEFEQLRARGAQLVLGHSAEHLLSSHPLLVVYSSAIRLDNPEIQLAQARHIPIVRRAVLLAALAHAQRPICVAGMHGKTTTTALLSFALEALHANPSYAIGALVPQLRRHARFSLECGGDPGLPVPNSKVASPLASSVSRNPGPTPAHSNCWFVMEADESDGTLREFHPQHALILNLDEEHLDYFVNLQAICAEFDQFARQTAGMVFFCADDRRLAELLASNPSAISYGFHELAGYRAVINSAHHGAPGSAPGVPLCFEVWRQGASLGTFKLHIIGEKNVSNATAVIGLLHQLGYTPAQIAAAIEPFTGAARRQQSLYHDSRFRVFEDYAHHPAEIQATITAFRHCAPRRLLVAFQPHRFTRTRFLLDQFATCFHGADRLWLTEIYAASEPRIAGIDGTLLANVIRQQQLLVEFVPSLRDLPAAIRSAMIPGDWVLFLGAGDITGAACQLSEQLKQEHIAPNDQILARLSERVGPATVLRANEPLAKRTTFRIGGPADIYAEPACEEDLAILLRFAADQQIPFTLIGRGSNLLIRDGGIRGLVVCLSHPSFSRVEFNAGRICCGAGVRLKQLAIEARRHGLGGLEFVEGIPGSLGGALRMNAGAMGCWIFDVVESLRLMDPSGRVQELPASEVYVEYRGCPLLRDHIALAATLKGKLASEQTVAEISRAWSRKRWQSQPLGPSAGCIFKNPKAIPAGKLIDELGLKGTRVGGAVVSEVHGNFIINDGEATAADVLNLIEMIQQRARHDRGIELQTEVQVLGED